MESETADILGQPTMPLMEKISDPPSRFSAAKWFLAFLVLFVVYAIAMRIRQEILIWREKSFKLATRRKHGIPDTDRRPFNVAYTAAMLAKDEREKNERNRMMRQLPLKPVQDTTTALDHHDSQPEQALRHRTDRFKSSASVALPGAYTLTPGPNLSPRKSAAPRESSPYSPSRPSFTDPLRPRKSTAPLYSDSQFGSSRHAARQIVDLSSEADARKRGLDEQDFDDVEPTKKTRLQDDDFIDGDEEAHWDDYETALSHQRGSKRGLGEDDQDSDNGRDKRARKQHLEKSGRHGFQDEEMDIDDELDDELPDLHSPVRGKKRDRAEAGSTFGGDDDDSSPEDEKLRRRRRKRRTVAKRKSEASVLNGKKRDRDMDVDEQTSPGTPSRGRHHKKGKRHSNVHRDEPKDLSDISIDESLASSARMSVRHRKVGEEWESNGVRYKVSSTGQRLRQALVKKARHKFLMPQDSVHPDRDENLEVYVETWLTEEEYQDAKDRLILAWQDSPKQSVEPETLSVKIPVLKQPQPHVGKNLLWQSTVSTPSSSPASASPLDGPGNLQTFRPKGLRNPARYSLGTHIGLRNNPFEKQSSISTKRIVSASIANQSLNGSPGLSDSTNSTIRPRTLSKWERQEIEANAIYKLRAARQAEIDAKAKEEKEKAEKLEKEKQEKERQEKERQEQARLEREKQEREKKEREAAAAAAAAAVPPVPTITITQPSADIKAPAPSGFSFGPSASSAPAPATNAGTAEALKTTFFAPPPQSTKPTASGTSAPSSFFGLPKVETAPAAQNLFSFKTPGAPASATTPTATQPPNTFSFGVPAASSKPSASPFGVPTEEKKEASKPASAFSFPPTASSSGGSVFGAGASSGQPSASSAPAPTVPQPAAPKFNFFGGGDTANSSGQSSVEIKPAATPASSSPFSFVNKAATAPTVGGSDAKPAANGGMFKMGGGGFSGTSAFGTSSNNTAASGAPASSTAASSSSSLSNAMGGSVFRGGPGGPLTFGSTTGNGAASTSTSSPFGQASSMGGPSKFPFGSQDKGKEPMKAGPFGGFGGSSAGGGTSSTPIFGGSASNSSLSGTTTAPKASTGFSFGGPSAAAVTTTPAGTPTAAATSGGGAGFSFKFGEGAGAAGGSKNIFGTTSQPASAFGFGTPTGGAPGGTAGSTTPAGTPNPVQFKFGS